MKFLRHARESWGAVGARRSDACCASVRGRRRARSRRRAPPDTLRAHRLVRLRAVCLVGRLFSRPARPACRNIEAVPLAHFVSAL
jgi:hypothetical protein